MNVSGTPYPMRPPPSPPPKTNDGKTVKPRTEVEYLRDQVKRLQETVDYQHSVIVTQQPTMSQLQWEAAKWNHFKRILEAQHGKQAAIDAETAVNQRMMGLI